MGIGIKKIFGWFAPRDPAAEYEKAKAEVTRRISGGGMTHADLENLSQDGDRAMESIKAAMKLDK